MPRNDEWAEGCMRELYVKFGKSAYVVRYRVTDDAVIVTRVWHGRQNRPR